MKAVLLSFSLSLFSFFAFAQSKEEQRQKDSVEIVSEIRKLIDDRGQLTSKVSELKAGIAGKDRLIRELKSRNQAVKHQADSLKGVLEEQKKTGGNSTKYKQLFKKWNHLNSKIEEDLRLTTDMETEYRETLEDLKMAEKLIGQMERKIQELRQLIYP